MSHTRQYVMIRSDDSSLNGTQLEELPDTSVLGSPFTYLLGGNLNYSKRVELQNYDAEKFSMSHRCAVMFQGTFMGKLYTGSPRAIYFATCKVCRHMVTT